MAEPKDHIEPEYESVTGHILEEYIPSKQKILSLADRAALRNMKAPNVSEADLAKYESEHKSGSVRRDSLDVTRDRQNAKRADGVSKPNSLSNQKRDKQGTSGSVERPTKTGKAEEVVNSHQTTSGLSKGAQPHEVLQSAIRRQGSDPNNPEEVKKLVARHTEARSAFTTAERAFNNRGRGGRSL